MQKVRIIGDVHGKNTQYAELTKSCDYSIQVGDMGFDYRVLTTLGIDSEKHKFIAGNHDNYDQYYESAHTFNNTKDFGLASHGGLEFFFVRGGFSIDWKQRQKSYLHGSPKSYWDNEELNIEEMEKALHEYRKVKPDVVITHECPRSISKHVGCNDILESFGYNPRTFSTKTSELLELMFQAHQPKRWYFGHYHNDWASVINGTTFICLNELGYIDLEI